MTGNGNQLQKISLQTISPTLEIRLASKSGGNLTLVIPRALLDKVEPNGMDDAFGVVANRAVGFEETSTTPTSRTLVVQFDPGVNYIQILGTKSVEPKINQAELPSSANTSESKTPTNMPETDTKSEVPLTEPKPPVSEDANKTSGIGLSIDNGTLGYKTVYEHTMHPKTFTPEEQAAIDMRCNVLGNNYSSLSIADRGWLLANC